jgi:hypothetical protein
MVRAMTTLPSLAFSEMPVHANEYVAEAISPATIRIKYFRIVKILSEQTHYIYAGTSGVHRIFPECVRVPAVGKMSPDV